ncbi:MAG: hypothetical protein IKW34_05510, partial [Clostridia bacterium]|nr:hypothetical protein [Clostridia bacterium]
MRKFFKIIKNFIKETDKILLLLCMLASAFGCVSVLSATMWTVGEGDRFSRDFIVMCAACIAGVIISIIISLIDYEFIMKMAPFIGLFCIGIMLLLFAVG